MATAVTLYASARFGFGGKQYIARIDGRDSKFTFSRTFVGKKDGKRGEDSEVMIDEAGLFERRNIDSKGRSEDVYLFVWLDGETARTWPVSREEAMAYAKRIEKGENVNDLAKEIVILECRQLIEEAETKDQDEMIQLRESSAKMMELDPLVKHARRDIIAARRAFLRRIDVTHAEEVSADLAEIKTELLIDELTKRGLRVVTPRVAKVPTAKSGEQSVEAASSDLAVASAMTNLVREDKARTVADEAARKSSETTDIQPVGSEVAS